MADSLKVEVRGIRELSSAFKRVDAELPKELKAAFLRIAGSVTDVARGKVPVISGKAASSIKPRASARGASIAFGGTAAEYFPWLNFGGRVGRNQSIVRERVEPDRYIYATIIAKRGETEAAVDGAVKEVARQAGFETKGGL